jgi:hypothetical protein
MVGEGCGEAKLVWSNGDMVVSVTKSGPNRLFFKISGGGIVRVAGLIEGGGKTKAVSDADGNDSKGGAGAEDSESCEWRKGGGGSVGIGGGTTAIVWQDDLEIFDEMDSRE